MADIGFGDFLSKMNNETSGRYKSKEKKKEVQYVPPKKIKPVVEEYEEDLYEEDLYEDNSHLKNTSANRSRIDEDFKDKAYDYAQGVVKVVRTNFKDKEERMVMLESLKSAINGYMQALGVDVTPKAQSTAASSNNSMWEGAGQMSESEWNNTPTIQEGGGSIGRMNDLTGTKVKLNNSYNTEGKYNTDMKIGVKVTNEGKYEADLSGISMQDIQDMRVLSGMVGKEAEIREAEMAAAKQEVAMKLAAKKNQD